MIFMWCSASFNYYLIGFLLKYLPGNMFQNAFSSVFSEIAGYVIGGLLYKMIGTRKSMLISLIISFTGGILIVFFGRDD